MAPRRDARRNRTALLAAAREAFAAEGANAPLEAISRRAEVGRATLDRHFGDRAGLAAAVYDDVLQEHEAFAEAHRDDPDAALRILRRIASNQPSMRGLTPLLATTPDGHEQLRALGERTRALFEAPLTASHRAGTLAPWVTPDDLVLVLAMVEGVNQTVPPSRAAVTVERCLHLVTHGITEKPSSRTGESRPSTSSG